MYERHYLQHTALTSDTLDRFERVARPEEVTGKYELVEHLAYCANMGARSKDEAWGTFSRLALSELGIDVMARYCTYSLLSGAMRAAEARRPRSAWDKGVKEYEIELLGELLDGVTYDDVRATDFLDYERAERKMLNGADDWDAFSVCGNSLICDESIARRLCTKSALRACDYGALDPRRGITWIAVQARALRHAALDAFDDIQKGGN